MSQQTQSAHKNMPTGWERLAGGLRRHGVRQIFGQSIPASLLLAAPDFGIRQIGYRAENAGGIMADGFARISGRIGVVTAQNGPAATLLVPPLAEAIKASVPVLALVEEIPASDIGRNAFQEFDHRALFASCAKWIGKIEAPERVDEFLDFAVTMATTGRPGPIVLLLPRDVLSHRSVQTSPRDVGLGHFPLDRTVPAKDALEAAAAAIRNARRPLLIAGGGVHISGACEALEQLAEKWAIPVATTNMGKGAISDLHPLSLGVFGNTMASGSAAGCLRRYVTEADVIVIVGTRTNQNGTDTWSLYPAGARIIHIDMDGVEVGRNYQSLRLVGDARETLMALAETLGDGPADTEARMSLVARDVAEARSEQDRHVAETGAGTPLALRPEALMNALNERLHEDDIVVADASYSTNWMCTHLRARRTGQRFLAPRGLAGLGWGVPLAMGAKLAAPTSRVITIVGDGGFGHCWSELETIKRMGIDIKIIVLNNRILGFQKHGENAFFGKHSDACNFAEVDHALIAKACGVASATLEQPGDIETAIDALLSSEEAMLLDVRTDDLATPPLTLLEGRDVDGPTYALEHT